MCIAFVSHAYHVSIFVSPTYWLPVDEANDVIRINAYRTYVYLPLGLIIAGLLHLIFEGVHAYTYTYIICEIKY